MTTDELKLQMLQRPRYFWHHGDLDLAVWGFSPFGVHRDSDTLDRSNWEVISSDLQERFPDSVEVMHTSHWAAGWYDHLMIDTRNEGALAAILAWSEKLENYPVADEEHWGRLEGEEIGAAWSQYARFDVSRACEKEGILCDNDGFWDPTEEQENTCSDITREAIYNAGGPEASFPLNDIMEEIRERFAA